MAGVYLRVDDRKLPQGDRTWMEVGREHRGSVYIHPMARADSCARAAAPEQHRHVHRQGGRDRQRERARGIENATRALSLQWRLTCFSCFLQNGLYSIHG